MKHLSHSILLLICLTVLFASFGSAQNNIKNLVPNKPTVGSIELDKPLFYLLDMKEDDFAEIIWLSNDYLVLIFTVIDEEGKEVVQVSSDEEESVVFIAPKTNKYKFVVEIDKSSKITGKQSISLEYNNKFRLPVGTKLNNFRKINGYDVKIMTKPQEFFVDNHFLLVEKNGKVKLFIKSGGDGKTIGFSFADDLTKAYTPDAKISAKLLGNTLDKTGDGIPDIMIDNYSGGSHCCSESIFINLGKTVEIIDKISTGHSGLVAERKTPKGGLIFSASDTSYAYWLAGFANSPFPTVIFDFNSGKLRPNFELMKKPPPSLFSLKKKAEIVRSQLSLKPYRGIDDGEIYKDEFIGEPVFWGLMLDLIYTGNEDLAWQYLNEVWSSEKQGKAIFREDLKNKIFESDFWQMIQEDRNKK